jgi:hypothetical protein
MAFKAYSYSESEHLSMGVHDRVLLEREKLLASEFVDSHPCPSGPGPCPMCGSGDTESFAVIGGAPYLRCRNCWSLFVPVSVETVSEYREYAPLRSLRESHKYQETGRQKRATVWREQLFWIEFRSKRYLRPLKELSVTEIGGRYGGFSELVKPSCASYSTHRTIHTAQGLSDVILCLGPIIQEPDPGGALAEFRKRLNKNGLLFLSSRVSTGFDILTLKGNIDSIYPYDCSVLPSVEALERVLKETGFDVLEISTPGTLDMLYVAENSSKLERNDLFTRYLIEKADDSVRSEFQRLLQKSMMSSHAQLVARACHG